MHMCILHTTSLVKYYNFCVTELAAIIANEGIAPAIMELEPTRYTLAEDTFHSELNHFCQRLCQNEEHFCNGKSTPAIIK